MGALIMSLRIENLINRIEEKLGTALNEIILTRADGTTIGRIGAPLDSAVKYIAAENSNNLIHVSYPLDASVMSAVIWNAVIRNAVIWNAGIRDAGIRSFGVPGTGFPGTVIAL